VSHTHIFMNLPFSLEHHPPHVLLKISNSTPSHSSFPMLNRMLQHKCCDSCQINRTKLMTHVSQVKSWLYQI